VEEAVAEGETGDELEAVAEGETEAEEVPAPAPAPAPGVLVAEADRVLDLVSEGELLHISDAVAVALAEEEAVSVAAEDSEGAPLMLAAADAAEEAVEDVDGEPVAVGLVQDAEPAVEEVPAAQGVHPDALTPGLVGAPKKPAAQTLQLLAAAAGVVVPTGQAEQAVRPAEAV